MKIDRNLHGTALGARLTDRQAEMLVRLAKRKTIKEIAGEFAISESAVNQHIKALKLAFAVNSLAELQSIYFAISVTSSRKHYRNPTARKRQVPPLQVSDEKSAQNEAGPMLSFHDSLTYHRPAPWDALHEPVIVPGVLNGTNSRWVRAVLMVAIAAGLFATVIVGLGAAQAVSAALKGSGVAPANAS